MVAQDHLAIPAAEVDAERLFSGGRDVLRIRRFSMKGKALDPNKAEKRRMLEVWIII